MAEQKPDSTYDVITLVGTSTISWEDAVKKIVEQAAKTLRNLRVAEVERLDVKMKDNKIVRYRARVKLSFKYEGGK